MRDRRGRLRCAQKSLFPTHCDFNTGISMELVVWNSQGQKWDYLYTTGLANRIAPPAQNTFGLTVEAGWAPWINPGEVYLGKPYPLDSSSNDYNAPAAAASSFVTAYQGFDCSNRTAFWVPWIANFDALQVNSRCSLGGAYFPNPKFAYSVNVRSRNIPGMVRPAVQLTLTRGGITAMTIYLVHFVSSRGAVSELFTLATNVSKIIDQGTPAIIVGDINVNILKYDVFLPNYWRLVNTGVPTQQKGGELDYGLLYDPNNNVTSTAKVIAKFKTATNPSDHSMVVYSFPRY